jgi:porin
MLAHMKDPLLRCRGAIVGRTRGLVGRLVVAALALSTLPAHAYDLGTSTYLLGDWGGLRTRLADEGVTIQLGYVGETAHNFSGGTEHLTLHADQWTFGTTLDLNRLWGWSGGTFQASKAPAGQTRSPDGQ